MTVSAADFNVAYEGLADRTAWLRDRIKVPGFPEHFTTEAFDSPGIFTSTPIVVSAGSHLVAFSSGGVAWRTMTGRHWTEGATLSAAPIAAYGAGKIVSYTGAGSFSQSSNLGASWSAAGTPSEAGWTTMGATSGGTFLAAKANVIIGSSNLSSWSTVSSLTFTPRARGIVTDPARPNDVLVIGSGSNTSILVSTNAGAAFALQSVAASPFTFVSAAWSSVHGWVLLTSGGRLYTADAVTGPWTFRCELGGTNHAVACLGRAVIVTRAVGAVGSTSQSGNVAVTEDFARVRAYHAWSSDVAASDSQMLMHDQRPVIVHSRDLDSSDYALDFYAAQREHVVDAAL